jgi:hypothetical protein
MLVALPPLAIYAACGVTLSCSVCLLTVLKRVLRTECDASSSSDLDLAGGSSLRSVAIACATVAAICLVVSAAYFVTSRAWSWRFVSALCSKWQPVYFSIVSVQRLVMGAMVASAVGAGGGRADLCAEQENLVDAASVMWLCAVVLASLSTMCCDLEAALSPALRRCAYVVLALVLVLDVIGSVVWGNALASDVKLGVSVFASNFSFLLENQLTSCIASQAVIALHFAYVSCRSRRGRGWAYASLRFELDECGRSMPLQDAAAMTEGRRESGGPTSAAAPLTALDASAPADMQRAGAGVCSVFAGSRQRWAQFQQWQVARCRVFVIPCVATRGAEEGGEAAFALERPAFGLRWLRPLQRLADAHPKFYVGTMLCFLALPSIIVAIVFEQQDQVRGIANLILTSILCVATLGFLSSRRYCLDRVAAKHVAQSFRFAICVTLLLTDIALNIRLACTRDSQPSWVAASALATLLFCLSIMLDCCPHLPPSVQMFTSVNACNAARATAWNLLTLFAGWMVVSLRIWYIFLCPTSFRRPRR